MLAARLAQACRRAALPIAGLTFVPLHPRRQRERGFNQAERLASVLGHALDLPVVAGLERVRDTPPQVGLSEAERQANVAGAFRWAASQVPPLGLALVDDVCTTGATLAAGASAIRQAGGGVAAFLVLARPQTLGVPAVTRQE